MSHNSSLQELRERLQLYQQLQQLGNNSQQNTNMLDISSLLIGESAVLRHLRQQQSAPSRPGLDNTQLSLLRNNLPSSNTALGVASAVEDLAASFGLASIFQEQQRLAQGQETLRAVHALIAARERDSGNLPLAQLPSLAQDQLSLLRQNPQNLSIDLREALLTRLAPLDVTLRQQQQQQEQRQNQSMIRWEAQTRGFNEEKTSLEPPVASLPARADSTEPDKSAQMLANNSVASTEAAGSNKDGAGAALLPLSSFQSAKGRPRTFPLKLYQMLTDLENDGKDDIASFLPDGSSFAIHKPEEFARDVIPTYFTMSRLSSFHRQLNLYSFRHFSTEDASKGAFAHPLFLKGRPDLLAMIQRSKKEKTSVTK